MLFNAKTSHGTWKIVLACPKKSWKMFSWIPVPHKCFIGCLNSSQWGLFQGIWGVDSRMELVWKLFVKACWYYMIYLYIYTYATDSHVKTVISRDFSCCLPNICFSQHSSSILTENLCCVRKNVRAETRTIKLYK